MNTPDTEWESVEEFAKELSARVRWASGYGQYENDSKEQQAYIDGVTTAIAMMYIDLTGTPKTKGMLSSRDTYWKERVEEELDRRLEIQKKVLHSEYEGGYTHALEDVKEALITKDNLK